MRADATSTKFCSTTDSSSESEVGCGLTDLSISFCFSDQDFRVFSNTWRKTKNIPEWKKKRERGGEGFGNKLCRSPNREKKREGGREREKMRENQRKHIKLKHSASWIHLPYPWSTFELYSCGRCGCIQGAASKPLHPPELALPHPPLWWFSHDDTTDKMGFILSNISKGTDTNMYHKISCIQTTIKYKKPSSHIFHTLKCYLTFSLWKIKSVFFLLLDYKSFFISEYHFSGSFTGGSFCIIYSHSLWE